MEETGELTDWEVGFLNMSLFKKVQEYKEVVIKKELDKLEVHLHADLEEILSRYLKYWAKMYGRYLIIKVDISGEWISDFPFKIQTKLFQRRPC